MALAGGAAAAAEEDGLTAQGVAGEILDIAVEQCRRGEGAQALQMLAAIRAQLDPPPAILRLIRELEATGCSSKPLAEGAPLRLQVGGGWDSNVSQGISSRTLTLGSGENTIELELDPSYRPHASAYVQASVDYSLPIRPLGINFDAAVGVRKNIQAPTFDLSTGSAALSREFRLGRGTLRGQLELSEVWLGNVHYQRSQGAALQWVQNESNGAWLATLTGSSVQYTTQPSQDARQWDVGAMREQRIDAAHTVYGGVSLQWDNAKGARPGGARQGFQVQAGAAVLGLGWIFKPQLVYTSWNSAEVFAPGLIDVPRRNRLTQAGVIAEKTLSPRDALVLEWRGRWARDTVSLYRYQARVISATLAHRF